MTTPPGQGYPGDQPGQQLPQGQFPQPGQPQQGQFAQQGQPPQFPQQGQFPQPGQPQGFPQGTGAYPQAPGQPQQFPQAPMGTPVKPRKRGLRIVLSVVGVVLAIAAYVVIRVVISTGVNAVVDSGNDAHQTAVGDCALVTGTTIKPNYEKVDCASGRQNYTVGQVLSSASDTCLADHDEYYETNKINPVKLCLVPVLTDGSCYAMDSHATTMGYPKVDCTAADAVQVKVVQGSTDKVAACGADGAETALVYPETKTTMCLSQPVG